MEIVEGLERAEKGDLAGGADGQLRALASCDDSSRSLARGFGERLDGVMEAQADLPEVLAMDARTDEILIFGNALNEAARKGELLLVLNGFWDGEVHLADRIFRFVNIDMSRHRKVSIAVRDSAGKRQDLNVAHYKITPQRVLRDGQKLA
ncbi:MAG: hypothetical protein AAB373_03425 [Patescibacteria group bacterium]